MWKWLFNILQIAKFSVLAFHYKFGFCNFLFSLFLIWFSTIITTTFHSICSLLFEQTSHTLFGKKPNGRNVLVLDRHYNVWLSFFYFFLFSLALVVICCCSLLVVSCVRISIVLRGFQRAAKTTVGNNRRQEIVKIALKSVSSYNIAFALWWLYFSLTFSTFEMFFFPRFISLKWKTTKDIHSYRNDSN